MIVMSNECCAALGQGETMRKILPDKSKLALHADLDAPEQILTGRCLSPL